MIDWKKQGDAYMGAVSFIDGRQGNVVLVGPRTNAKGAVLALAAEHGEQGKAIVLAGGLSLLHPRDTIDIISMQERSFGDAGLPAPENAPQ